VESGNNLIIVGGFGSSGNSAKTYKSEINSDGTISAWTQTSTLPEPVYRSGVIRIGSTLISAGSNQITLGNKVFYVNINSDGTLGAWQTSSNTLPQAVGAGAITYSNGYLYLTGGLGSGGYLNTVYYAPFNISGGIDLGVPDLGVPLLKQTDPLWGTQVYNSANLWAPGSSGISSWGCALTSAAMVFQYHKITKLPDNSNLDPGSLNTWLKNHPDGYIRNGLVNWLALSRLSKLAKAENSDFTYDVLEYKRAGGDQNQLKTDLGNNIPDILEEPRAFYCRKGY